MFQAFSFPGIQSMSVCLSPLLSEGQQSSRAGGRRGAVPRRRDGEGRKAVKDERRFGEGSRRQRLLDYASSGRLRQAVENPRLDEDATDLLVEIVLRYCESRRKTQARQ